MEKMQRFLIRMLGLAVILADLFFVFMEDNMLYMDILGVSAFQVFLILGLVLFFFPGLLLGIINALEAAKDRFRDAQMTDQGRHE